MTVTVMTINALSDEAAAYREKTGSDFTVIRADDPSVWYCPPAVADARTPRVVIVDTTDPFASTPRPSSPVVACEPGCPPALRAMLQLSLEAFADGSDLEVVAAQLHGNLLTYVADELLRRSGDAWAFDGRKPAPVDEMRTLLQAVRLEAERIVAEDRPYPLAEPRGAVRAARRILRVLGDKVTLPDAVRKLLVEMSEDRQERVRLREKAESVTKQLEELARSLRGG